MPTSSCNAATRRQPSSLPRCFCVSPDDPDSRKASADALGEICNIVAGYFKAKVGLGDTCMLSVPTIIVGQDYKFHSARMFQKLELAVSYEEERLLATLEMAI